MRDEVTWNRTAYWTMSHFTSHTEAAQPGLAQSALFTTRVQQAHTHTQLMCVWKGLLYDTTWLNCPIAWMRPSISIPLIFPYILDSTEDTYVTASYA
eukprot:2183911-Amphidinium_carterae.1